MNQSELIDRIAVLMAKDVRKTNIGKAGIDIVLDVLGIVVGAALFDGIAVSLPHLGKLDVKSRKSRKGRNPRTGAPIDIPAGRTVVFRPSVALKHTVNC